MVAIADNDITQRVGQIDMRIRCGDRTLESQERWGRRSDVLAAWLMDQWNRHRQVAERN